GGHGPRGGTVAARGLLGEWGRCGEGSLMITRRGFVRSTATGVALGLVTGRVRDAVAVSGRRALKAIAFDAFPVFSPASVVARAEVLFPGRGAALGDEWRLRQFEYAWLRILSRQYVDFWQVTGDALDYASRKLGLDLDG